MRPPQIYIAASFKHMHAVRLLGQHLREWGFTILDWTEKASLPPGLTPAQRRQWMDTDQAGGQVFSFCRDACLMADMLVYYGASGQDAGVEVGIAAGAGVPILGIRGPLEAPGLMLHGAMTIWAESIEDALDIMHAAARLCQPQKSFPDCGVTLTPEQHAAVQSLCRRYLARVGEAPAS